ncbi:hypothetical protein BM531_23705 [Clostridioides difficile]|nr:hypothetical protein BM531_23705 [Clostridioides difficile]
MQNKSIDTSEAEKVVGVRAIATYLNTSQRKYNGSIKIYEHKYLKMKLYFQIQLDLLVTVLQQ